MEIWKDVVGYEGLYQISNLGRVKSVRQNKLMSLKRCQGYLRVGLRHRGKEQRSYFVHRLVAEAFIPNPHNYPQINHKDECRTNNNVENLEWCTAKYNCNYGTHTLKMIQNTDYSKVNYKARHEHTDYAKRYLNTDYTNIKASTKARFAHRITQFTLNEEKVKEWLSLRDVEKELKIDRKEVAKCCKGIREDFQGYKWKYTSQTR